MVEEIGTLIFSQLLRMSEYPGSPFTGDVFRDIIMFLIVPTTFIIIVIYTMTGKVLGDNVRLRVLLGVASYLFIVAGGYYATFALIAGPYFLFLIFIMGLLYYLVEHFTGSKIREAQGGGGFIESGGHRNDYPTGKGMKYLLGIPELNPVQVKYLNNQLKDVSNRIQRIEKQIETAEKHPGSGDTGRMTEQLLKLMEERHAIESKLGIQR
jgi:hypothetical protein